MNRDKDFSISPVDGPAGILRKIKHSVSEMSTDIVKEKMTNLSLQIASGLSSISGHDSPTTANMKLQQKNSMALKTDRRASTATCKYEVSDYRISQFEQVLQAENVDLAALRKLCWNGIPARFRSLAWQLLLGYVPTNKSRRQQVIARKRQEYHEMIQIYYKVPADELTNQESEILRQILKDIPRTCPDSPFFQQEPIQRAMERILFLWSIRHPASGYVQGMDDLLTPMLYLALFPYVPDDDVMRVDVAKLDIKIMKDIEADSYWCLSKLLDNIHDHYTFSQPGLQRMLLRLQDLIHRLDNTLYTHLETEGIQYIQFGFRWMNCLLLREISFACILRLWDTYLSEITEGFENFHVYVCAVLLKTFQNDLLTMNYEELLIFLQDMPTKEWNEDHMEPVLSQAFILSTLFENSPNHLN